MPKSQKLEALLERLRQLRQDPTGDSAIAELQQILKSKYAVAVAQAAKIVGDAEITALVLDLVAAFERFLVNPAESDPNCHAKVGIVDALYRLNYSQEAVFLKGIRHVQMEPVWGGRVDTAPTLRGTCAMGLVRMNYSEVLTELADLLADPESPARIAAARAIAYSENLAGVPLLRLRAKVGDEPPVVSECLSALLKLAPASSLSFVTEFLADSRPQMQELTALTLGESRLLAAFEPLKQWWQRIREPELRQTGLLAIALLRQESAVQFLLSLVQQGTVAEAKEAIVALHSYRQQASLWQQVEAAVADRDEATLNQALNQALKF